MQAEVKWKGSQSRCFQDRGRLGPGHGCRHGRGQWDSQRWMEEGDCHEEHPLPQEGRDIKFSDHGQQWTLSKDKGSRA